MKSSSKKLFITATICFGMFNSNSATAYNWNKLKCKAYCSAILCAKSPKVAADCLTEGNCNPKDVKNCKAAADKVIQQSKQDVADETSSEDDNLNETTALPSAPETSSVPSVQGASRTEKPKVNNKLRAALEEQLANIKKLLANLDKSENNSDVVEETRGEGSNPEEAIALPPAPMAPPVPNMAQKGSSSPTKRTPSQEATRVEKPKTMGEELKAALEKQRAKMAKSENKFTPPQTRQEPANTMKPSSAAADSAAGIARANIREQDESSSSSAHGGKQ